MLASEIKSITSKTVGKLLSNYKPIKVILFGSYAGGSSDADSELDLLIIKRQMSV